MRTPPLTVIARSPCDEAIQGPRAVAPGLLRCARNDGEVDGAILGHRLCQTTSCRDSIPVSRLFNALQAGKVSLPLFSERRIRRWRCSRLRGETRGFGRTASCRRRSRFFPRFSIYQWFASRKISLPLLSERRVRRWPCGRFRNEALLSVGARGRPRARIPDVVAWRLPRPIPFSGPDSIFSSRCGAISGQVRPSLTMRPVSEQARCFHRERVRTARSRNGDRVRPSARSSWG